MLLTIVNRLKPYKRYGIDLLLVVVLLVGYRACQSYRSFQWVHVNDGKSVFAVPAFRK